MRCNRCGAEIPDNAVYCAYCGLNIRGPRKKRWEQYRFTDCNLDDLTQWFLNYGDKITVLSVRGNIRFEEYGLFNVHHYWYAPYFSIRFYPEAGENNYYFYYNSTCSSIVGFLQNGSRSKIYNEYEYFRQQPNTMFSIYKESYLKGGIGINGYAMVYSAPKAAVYNNQIPNRI